MVQNQAFRKRNRYHCLLTTSQIPVSEPFLFKTHPHCINFVPPSLAFFVWLQFRWSYKWLGRTCAEESSHQNGTNITCTPFVHITITTFMMQIVENKEKDVQQVNNSYPVFNSLPEENGCDGFGDDLYASVELLPVQTSNPVQDALPPDRADEESKIEALINASDLDCQRQTHDACSAKDSGRGRDMLERKTPPRGYICHRCKVAGHLIQHCSTNDDPNYDIKRAVSVLKSNESVFEKEMEGILSTTKSTSYVPPGLLCPLCNEVMKDAAFTSKCCFRSFCDKCIRQHALSKSMCVCGVTSILADDLLPNKTLRDTINNFMESNHSSAEYAGSMSRLQDTESARPTEHKFPSPTHSATSKGDKMSPTHYFGRLEFKKTVDDAKDVCDTPKQSLEKAQTTQNVDAIDATFELMTMKRSTSQGSPPLASEGGQGDSSSREPGKEKKKKEVYLSTSGDLQWRGLQGFAAENYMMHFVPSASNPYWGGMQHRMDGFMNPYAGTVPYMGYAHASFDVPIRGVLPENPFGSQGYEMSVPPPREVLKNHEFNREANSRRDMSRFKSNCVRHFSNRPTAQTSPDNCHHWKQHQRGAREPSRGRFNHHQQNERKNGQDQYNHRHNQSHHHRHLCESKSRCGRPPYKGMPSQVEVRRMCRSQPLHEVRPVYMAKRTSNQAYQEAADDEAKKRKASAFSRLSIPDGGNKKWKYGFRSNSDIRSKRSKDYVPSSSSPSHQHYMEVSTDKHHEDNNAAAAVAIPRKGSNYDHESSGNDDERTEQRFKSCNGTDQEDEGAQEQVEVERLSHDTVGC